MKTSRLWILALGMLCTQLSWAEGIEFFHGTWQEALAQAKAEDKILFVDAYAKWCGPCKRMAKNVFTQAEVGEFFNDNFINLKLDMEEADGRTFGKEYPVSAYPTLYFLGGNGEVVKKIRGGQKAASLIQHGKGAMSSYDRSGNYEALYLEGDRSYDLVHSYTKALAQVGKPHLKIANEYLRSNPDITLAQRALFVYDAATDVDSKIFEEMIDAKDLVVEQVGEEAFDTKVRKACLAAIPKSVEYDYPELMETASQTGRDHLHVGAKTFNKEMYMHYAVFLNDGDMYASYAKQYAKAKKFDNDVLDKVILQVNDHFDKHEASLKLAADLVKKSEKYGSIPIAKLPVYTKMLALGNEKKKAMKILESARKDYEDGSTQARKIDGLINYIESLES